jgi:methionine synthase II (cobalamin-independent)
VQLKEKLSLHATAIGSLPHDNPGNALDLIFDKLPDFPIWPQLSKVSPQEDMIIQYTENIPGIVYDKADNRWYFDVEKEDFYEKLEELFLDYESIVTEGNLESLDKYAISKDFSSTIPLYLKKIVQTKPLALKGQITGPFTWGTSLVDRDKKCAFYDETLREVIVKGLTLKALWQIVQFKKHSPQSIPVIFLDEPTMSQFGTSAFITVSKEDIIGCISEISSVLRRFGAIVGIHCCGKTDWSLVMDCNIDIINFDAFFFAENLSLYSADVEKFLKKGGFIAWGIVPTLDIDSLKTSSAESLAEKFEYAKNLLVKKGIDEELIIKSSIITPTCGAGGLNLQLASLAIDYLQQIEKILKDKYLTKVGL